MSWKSNCPDYSDLESRDAYRAGYSDGYYRHKLENGDWPIQPYSRGYWEGYNDKMDQSLD